MKKKNIYKRLVSLFLISTLLGFNGAFAQDTEVIMKKFFARPKPKTQRATMSMVLLDKKGKKTPRTLKMVSRDTAIGTDSYTEFITPADVSGTKFLTVGNDNGKDDQRLWLPDLGKIRKIAASGKKGKFMGSDFTYYDMESKDFDDSKFKYIKEDSITYTKDGVKKPRKCWVIEGKPLDPDSPYSRVLYWISQEDYFCYKSEHYNLKGEKDKTLYMISAKTIDDVIVVTKNLASSTNGHKTLLTMKDIKINEKIDQKYFSIKNLQ